MIFPFVLEFNIKTKLSSETMERKRAIIQERIKERYRAQDINSFYVYKSRVYFENYFLFNRQLRYHMLAFIGSGFFTLSPQTSSVKFSFSMLMIFKILLALGLVIFFTSKNPFFGIEVFLLFYSLNLIFSYFRLNSFVKSIIRDIEEQDVLNGLKSIEF